jgi:dihydroorotate dehydrogenase (fumarate)
VEALEATPRLHLSDSSELLLRLRWLAILSGQVRASWRCRAACTRPLDAVKAVMAGASAVQVVSRLLQDGPGAGQGDARRAGPVARVTRVRVARADARQHEPARCPDPAAFERGNYMRILQQLARGCAP